MSLLRCLFLSLVLLAPSLAHAARLGIPGPGTTLSGIGVISGWKCQANGPLTVSFDGGDPIPLVYGSKRPDVLEFGACASAEVGFVAIWNWGNLDSGEHTAVAYDNGVEFARSTFTVVRASEEFPFLTGVTAECTVPGFPGVGTNARFEWNTTTQHLELAEVGNGLPIPVSTEFDGRWDFTLELTHDLSGNCGCYREQQRGGSFYVDEGYVENDAGDTECATGVEQPIWTGIVSPYGELEGSASNIDEQEAGDPFFAFSWSGFLREDGTGGGSWFNTAGCRGRWSATWTEDD